MLRIVQIYKDYDPVVGGIENHVKVLAEGLAARGHTVSVLVTNTGRGTVVEQRQGVQVVKAGRIWKAASTPLSIELVRYARTLQADLVNLHMPYPPGDLAAHAIKDAPLVVTYHSDIVRQRKLLRLYRPLLEWTLRRSKRIIATSEPYVQSSPFLRRYAAKCRIVPLSVDAARFADVAEAGVAALRRRYTRSAGDCLILSVGVLRYYKGLHILLDALTQLDATLLIVGAGPEEQRLRDLAQAFGIARRVHFAGHVPDADLPTYYRAADVFVLASHLRAEAFGIVQLEAMAAGCPVVSTDLGTGTSVVNQHGVSGFVVPPGDPLPLATALRVLLANPELRRRLGAQAQRRVADHFTHAHMIDRTLEVYEEALARRQAGRVPCPCPLGTQPGASPTIPSPSPDGEQRTNEALNSKLKTRNSQAE
ncbi:MAG TPA: glycosyltransferase [Herpetosiphonaceae bacterium]